MLIEKSTYHTTTLHKLLYEYGCLPEGWEDFFNRRKDMIKIISDKLDEDKDLHENGLNPKLGWVFRALYMVPPEKIKVVVVGQDPAPQPGLATGLSFSLDPSVPSYKVPSVQRVILEAMNEGYCINITGGVLIPWAKQGVLLLNTALTLVPGKIGSHIKLWRSFSRDMLKYINDVAKPSVWILWGSKAKYFRKYINEIKHYVIAGGHPSPRANPRKFFCQNYYYCANEFLCSQKRGQVDWNLEPLPCFKNASHLYGRRGSYPGYYLKEPCMMQPCPERQIAAK